MPLGNLTSQFFANVYLNELDKFVKHVLKAKYYIRYVDDFVLLHSSKGQLERWKMKISEFLAHELKLQLHPDKSKIIPLARGIDFVGFRNLYHCAFLRRRSIRKMRRTVELFERGEITYRALMESYQGWQAHAKWADTFNLRKDIAKAIHQAKKKRLIQSKEYLELVKYL